jgi:hypothetical protein
VNIVEKQHRERHQRQLSEEVEAATGGQRPEPAIAERPRDRVALELLVDGRRLANHQRGNDRRADRQRTEVRKRRFQAAGVLDEGKRERADGSS